MKQISEDGKPALEVAMQHMKAALELLDRTGAPADIGAHLDLAINRLEAVSDPADTSGRAR